MRPAVYNLGCVSLAADAEANGKAEAQHGAAATEEAADKVPEAQEGGDDEEALEDENLPSTLFYGVRGQQVLLTVPSLLEHVSGAGNGFLRLLQPWRAHMQL